MDLLRKRLRLLKVFKYLYMMKGVKMVIDKKIVLDNKGKPYEVITLKKAQKAREQGDFKDFVKEEDF